MSHFNSVRTKITDPEVMAEALLKYGLPLTVHEEEHEVFYQEHGSKLKYKGTTPKSKYIVHRESFSNSESSGDLGFMQESDGTFSMLYGSYDGYTGRVSLENKASETNKPGLGRPFFQEFPTTYAETSVEITCRESDYQISDRQVMEDGSIRLTVTAGSLY